MLFFLFPPMGVSGKDNLLRLAKGQLAEVRRFGKVEKTDEDNEIGKKVLQSIKEFVPKNKKRAINELRGMVSADEYEVLDELKQRGVKVGVVQGFDDKLSNYGRLMSKIGEGYEPTIRPVTLEDNPREGQTHVYEPPATLPPIDSTRLIRGGHEILGPHRFAGTIIRTLDYLDHPPSKEEVVDSIQQGRENSTF